MDDDAIISLLSSSPNSNQIIMVLNNKTLRVFFSYKTVIGFSLADYTYTLPRIQFRRKNQWSRTTGMHMSKMGLNSDGWKEIPDDAFFKEFKLAIAEIGMTVLSKRIQGEL